MFLITTSVFLAFSALATGEKFVLWQSFEEIVTPGLPAGWTVVNQNMDDRQWETTKFGGLPERHQCARYNGNPALPASDWLFTPSVNLEAGTNYTLSFLCMVSETSVQKMKIFFGNSPDPSAMTTLLVDYTNLTNTTLQTYSVDFTVPVSGSIYFGFYCYSDPNQKQFFLDDIQIACPTSELSLVFILTKKLLDPGTTPVFGTNDTIEGWTILTNTSPVSRVLNTSFGLGPIYAKEYELSYIVIPPDGDTLQFVIRTIPAPLSTNRKYEQVDPGKYGGRLENLQKLFAFSQTGTYTVRAFYRNYFRTQTDDAWLGSLFSDPVTFIIQ